MDGNVLSVSRTIAAPPDRIFAYLADAAKHPLIDGSGTVEGPSSAQPGEAHPLQLGTRFGMSMRSGFRYRMVNTVVEFEANRRIAWQPKAPGLLGRVIGGRIWRYVLEPREDGTTAVTEQWDLTHEPGRLVIKQALAKKTEENMGKTLDRLAELATGA